MSVFGQLTTDNGLVRIYLMGEDGDRINAILAGCGSNFWKVLRATLFIPDFIQSRITQIWQHIKNIDSGYQPVQTRAA